jgi:hypothetical protein
VARVNSAIEAGGELVPAYHVHAPTREEVQLSFNIHLVRRVYRRGRSRGRD